MGITFERFLEIANSTSVSSRDIVLDTQKNSVKLGGLVFSAGKTSNTATMNAFRDAISQRFGVFGEHAFDTVLGSRSQMKKSLRACDVKQVFTSMESLKEKRYLNELKRQLDTNPVVRELSKDMRQAVRNNIADNTLTKDIRVHLRECANPTDLAKLVSKRISKAIAQIESEVSLGRKLDTKRVTLQNTRKGEQTIASNQAAGLLNLKTIFGSHETSIEDQMKSGKLGVGMTINRSPENAVTLVKLKTNGVEPGFIFKNDWSLNDTKAMMGNIESQESLKELAQLKEKHPDIAARCENLSTRDQIMLFGRRHSLAMAAVSEYMIEKGMNNPNSRIYKAFCEKFPDTSPEQWRLEDMANLKKELFVEIRDAVLNVKKGDPDYNKSPVFKHFTDHNIVKLDYNESNKVMSSKKGSAGKFMRPERIKVGRTAGQIYRLQTATTADKSSVGAVTEALANDLSRICGVPSQQLSIVRGQFSDGHPKIMLKAAFAEGYTDMENGFIKDGQIVPPNGQQTENLGRYKAFFLVTADRDAVGSRGQNKGFIQGQNGQPGTFFAIDPGHSLEGNGRFLEVNDNFSFKDTYGFSTKPRFKNFSVFDDDTRFAKFQGALDLRTLQQSEKSIALFNQYRASFDPQQPGIPPEEVALRQKIQTEINKKEAEFNDSMAKVLSVAENQFRLYDDLAADGPVMQQNAIETIENLEKLTSPTTWVSPKGEVALKHLSVIPETRIAWRAHVDGDNLVYHCDQPLSGEAQEMLRAMANAAGASLTIDDEGCARLTIAKANAGQAFSALSEENVAMLTHRDEAAARSMGETGLQEARNYAAQHAHASSAPKEDAPAFALPERLEVRVGDDRIVFRKPQYEAMLANTPEAERPRTLDDFKKILASRIQRGRDIANDVLNGNGHRYAATQRNVACLTLAFHAATMLKGEYNERGSFSVSDPNGRLYKWLDTSKDIYLRTSTHARTYHSMNVDGHMNMPRGIDIKEGMGGLMGGMRTLHYFSLPTQDDKPRRLFLKCETYGIFRNTITADQQEKSRPLGMQTRQAQSGDTVESIKHALSLFTVFTRMGKSEGNRKENTPKSVMTSLETAQRQLRNIDPRLADMLGQGVKTGGIRVLMENMLKVLEVEHNRESIKDILDEVGNTIMDFLQENDQLSGYFAERMGNEVMLTTREITGK